jgi:hypothetical protein
VLAGSFTWPDGCSGTLGTRPGPFPVEMIGRGWGCTGTSLAPPTTSLTSSALYWLLRGTVPRPEHLKEAKPRSIPAAPDPCFHRQCDCRRASHHLLLLGLATRSPFEKVSGRKYDMAVRLQSQCSANPMLTSDANLLFASRPRWLSSQAPAPPPGAPHSRATFPFAC